MTYFVVESFGHGLDVRKHILNLPPGALYRARNCNLNRGGEPESAKAFVPFANLPPSTFGLLSAGGKLYVFGDAGYTTEANMPAGITYQRLQHQTGTAMTAYVYGTVVKGKPFVIADFVGGRGVFFNGQLITDWVPPAGGTTMLKADKSVGLYASTSDIAINFAGQINADAIYTATAAGSVVTITGRPGTPFSISATALNGSGGVDDQTAVVATTQAADAGTGVVGATGSITFSGVQPDWNDQVNGGAGGYVPTTVAQSVKVNGVEILNQPGGLVASDDGGAADAVANYINLYHSTPEYTATSSGGIVTIISTTTGTGPNGFSVVVDNGNNYRVTTTPMAGGSGGTAAKNQISTVTFGGTFEAADSWAVTIAGKPFTIASYVPPSGGDTGGGGSGGGGTNPSDTKGQRPTAALTKNSKTYAIAGPNLFGSKIADCTEWDADPDPSIANGSFITDMSSEVAGADVLTALGIFQGNLAIFSRSTVQIQFVDPDPANNEQLQVLQNIGTMAAKSVVSFGDTDLFFLSDTGLRSLKVRAATNNATLSDIGSPIDALVIAAIKATGAVISQACAAIDPIDGRFLLQIGTTTYVFNYFPDAKVGGWTTYETGLPISDFAPLETRLFARAGDVVYMLGGVNNDTYSAQPMDIKLPFLSSRQIATLKHFTALDVVCDGVLDVSISTDPQQPDVEESIGTFSGTNLGLGIDPFAGEDVTALSLHLVGRPSKYARLSSVAVHHQVLRENA
jgi:hypothetical protein